MEGGVEGAEKLADTAEGETGSSTDPNDLSTNGPQLTTCNSLEQDDDSADDTSSESDDEDEDDENENLKNIEKVRNN